MSGQIATSRLRTGSKAGAAYVPPDRKGSPAMLKQYGGKVQTGFARSANSTASLQVLPPSVDLVVKNASPLWPCRPLSKVRWRVPSGAETMRASWLFRMLPEVTLIGAVKFRAPSREYET